MPKAVPIAILTAAFLAGCGKKSESVAEAAPKAPEAIAVRTAKAETRRVEKNLLVTGELAADETVAMRFEVGGRVANVRADFGQLVKKGDILAELDPTEYRLQVEKARAVLAQALARVGLTPDQANVVPQSSPAIRQAEAQLADAKSKYDSAAKLIQTGDVARERFVELEKSMQARQAALEAMRDELRVQVANIESLKAEVKLAEKRLNDTVIRAPFDGAVIERMVSPGQFIKDMENTPVLRMVSTAAIRLRVSVPETASGTVKVGSKLTFVTDAAPGQTFTATVQTLNPSLDAKSRIMIVEAKLPNPGWKLRPGTFVQVRLTTSKDVEIVSVPKRALYNVAGLTKVFAVRDGKAVEYRVAPGVEGPDWMEVPSGTVQAGDMVAVSNLAALVDKASVKAN
ncbi:MAG: efflux RND transporter periplasmic adaptor subunit [Bryobacteraceae bacterium]|nr:efflux RND transporter periplasmic adaptor subunit [Bryobacteraceae bacterium]